MSAAEQRAGFEAPVNAVDEPGARPLDARSASRLRPWKWGSLVRVAGLLLLGTFSALLHARALAAAAVVGVVLVAAFVLPWLTVRGVRACFHYPLRRGQVGKPLPVRLTLRSRLPWPAVGLLVRGGWADAGSSSEDPLTVAAPRVPSRGERVVAATAIPGRRGVYPRAPASVATGFPFGLWRARRAESEGELLVWPEIVPLAALPRPSGGLARGVAARAARERQQGEFAGTRPYRVGEPLRRIHWKQSARHDELVVWESRAVAQDSAVLLLETSPELHVRRDGADSLETTLSLGASIAGALLQAGLRVTLAFERDRVLSVGNRQQLEAALDSLARFDASRGTDLPALLALLPPRTPRSGAPWVVTTLRGWDRLGANPLAARCKGLVIDEREAGKGQERALPSGRLALAPLVDPGRHRLLDAWKEVALAVEALA